MIFDEIFSKEFLGNVLEVDEEVVAFPTFIWHNG
jgi:hypothetical protein